MEIYRRPVITAVTGKFSEQVEISTMTISTFIIRTGTASFSGKVTKNGDEKKVLRLSHLHHLNTTSHMANITNVLNNLSGNAMIADKR